MFMTNDLSHGHLATLGQSKVNEITWTIGMGQADWYGACPSPQRSKGQHQIQWAHARGLAPASIPIKSLFTSSLSFSCNPKPLTQFSNLQLKLKCTVLSPEPPSSSVLQNQTVTANVNNNNNNNNAHPSSTQSSQNQLDPISFSLLSPNLRTKLDWPQTLHSSPMMNVSKLFRR